ncbi:MAG: sulfite exporter TauE/SafE family protein [Haloferacaceae archaeon]
MVLAPSAEALRAALAGSGPVALAVEPGAFAAENLGVAVAAAFAVGLVGSTHCLGMCGPLVTLYSDRSGTSRGSFGALRQHLLFNAGRTAGYTVAGALLGALGATAFAAASVASVADGVRAVAGVVAGVVILAAGLGYLLDRRVVGFGSVPYLGGWFRAVHDRLVGRVDDLADGPGIALLGVAHTLLPCPLLYPAFLFALVRGSPLEGALVLGALGLGTFPTLFAYGAVLDFAGGKTRQRLHRAIGAAFLVLGLIPLTHGLALAGVPMPHLPFHG